MLGHDVAVAHRVPAECGPVSFTVPFELLKSCEGMKPDPVVLEREAEVIVARWSEAGIPQSARFAVQECEPFPPLPKRMKSNGPELLAAFRDASATAEREATRYALQCLQLRGQGGRIAATDSRQLYVHDGFAFPWKGDVLVPALRSFADFATDEPVEIGCTKDWATLRTGSWTIHLRIEKESRFPRVETVIPDVEQAATVAHLSDSDAEFLSEAVQRLPGRDDEYAAVTVDLNGAVAIRAKGAEETAPTELVLSGSRCEGAAICFETNRQFLERAVRLGFRDLHVLKPDAPVVCRDVRRLYLWMPLGDMESIPPHPDAVRIESPAESAAGATTNKHKKRRTNASMARKKTTTNEAETSVLPQNGQSASSANANGEARSASALEQAEALRDTLRRAQSQAGELVTTLRKRQKQSRLVESTLASLRQLENVEA